MNITEKTKSWESRYGSYAALTAIAFIASGLIAQPMLAEAKRHFGQPKSADAIMQTLTERLDLTPQQVDAVQPIIEEKVERHNEIWENTDTDRQTRRAEMRKLRWDTEIRLSEILSDEQVDKYLELKHEQRKAFKRGRHHGGWMRKGMHGTPEQAIERLRTRLGLTDEQAAQAGPIIHESIEKKRAVFEKYREKGLKVKREMRGEIRAIGDETHAQLSAILSDEQNEELNRIREHKRERMDRWMERRGSTGLFK